MGTIDTLLRVKADATQAVSGLKPLQASLAITATSAKTTEAALSALDGAHKVSLNDDAIKNAESEIKRLREKMRQDLTTDVNADVRPAQARIRQLQSSIKTLGQDPVKVEVDVEENISTSLSRGAIAGLAQGALSSGLSAMPGKLSAISGAARAAAPALEEAGLAVTGLGAAATGVGIVVAIPIAAGILVDFGFKAASAAADVETMQIGLNALTGGKGIETLQFLQQWAKETPFELSDAAQTFKLLASAGVPLNQISNDMNALGNAASATSTGLASLTLPISQMLSSGRASYENLQQFTELTGVSAFEIIAHKMHLTVAEVQKLATEGKLGKDAVQVLINELGKKFPTAMDEQAHSLNGQLSSLKDTMTQTKQTVSATFLPAMEAITPTLQDLADIAQNFAIIWLASVQKVTDNPITKDLLLPLSLEAKGLHLIKTGSDSLVKSLGLASDSSKDFTGGNTDAKISLDDAATAAADYAKELKSLQDAVDSAVEAFSHIGENVRLKVNFLISQDDARDAVATAIKGSKDTKAVTLPANLNINQISMLSSGQKQLIGDITSFVEAGLAEGSRREKINPDFDSKAFGIKLRQQTRGMLISAGVDKDQVDRVLDNVIGLPRKTVVDVSANMTGAERDMNNFLGKKRKVPVVPFVDEKTARAAANSPLFTTLFGAGPGGKGKKAPIAPTVAPAAAAAASGTLNNVAQPHGGPRVAHIRPVIDALSSNDLALLDRLLAPATKTIKIHMQENPTGDTIDVNRFLGSGLAGASSSVTKTVVASTTASPTTVQLTPKTTPVKVFLDGEEIASHLDLETRRLSTVGVRRRA